MSEDVGIVIKEVCDNKHENLKENIGRIEIEVKEYRNEQMTLKEAVIILTQLVEDIKRQKPFWETDFGRKVLNYLFWVISVLLAASLGINFIKQIPIPK